MRCIYRALIINLMRIVVTEKGNELLREELPSISPIVNKRSFFETPNVKFIKVKISNMKTNEKYNVENKIKQISKSISIREVIGEKAFDTPIVKKDFKFKKVINSATSRKQIINNLKSLASSIKIIDNKNFNQIVKKETVSPVFLKKLGVYNEKKINVFKKIEKINYNNLVSSYKYN
jgi:hypothetical protein